MATWIAHLRLAERLLPRLGIMVEEKAFYIGNIAPDCGEPDAGGRGYEPSVSVTHWTKTGLHSDTDSEGFFTRFLSANNDNTAYSFYLGYYLHLLADVIWTQRIALPNAEEHKARFDADEHFIDEVKKDWYDQDRLFLSKNPCFRPILVLLERESFPNYFLDYFSADAFDKKLRVIAEFYGMGHGDPNRAYPYLQEPQMDDFIDAAEMELIECLKLKDILP